jgi:predicted O-methyltransferase YrrM
MKQLELDTPLYDYILDKSLRETAEQAGLREKTSTMALAVMQVSPIQAQFMQMLIRITNAKKVLELGTFTGYSALAMSLALPDDGRLITCDINNEWTKVAYPFWEQAGQAHKIELKLAPADQTLEQMIKNGEEHSFDLMFIDADKANYVKYYELGLKLIKPDGLLLVDNVLWSGKVIDETETGGQTREIRKLNDLIKSDDRVDVSMLPIADGLTLVRPKKSTR